MIEYVATPLATVPVPSEVVPLRRVTVPEGSAPFDDVALQPTDWNCLHNGA